MSRTIGGALAFTTIRERLLAGFAAVIVLLAVAGVVGRLSLTSLSEQIGRSLSLVRNEAELSARITSNVARELAAGARYLEAGDSVSQFDFRRYGWEAHAAQRGMNASAGLSSEDVALIASIDQQLSAIEIELAQAHRLRDLQRVAESRVSAEAAHPIETTLLADIQQLGVHRAKQMDATSDALRAEAQRRSAVLLAVISVAIMLGIAIVVGTVRSISTPLSQLVTHARALSVGRLDVRSTGDMPGEFRELAGAMNTAGESLSAMVDGATATAEDVSTSAHQLASAAGQISLASSQTASAMSEVTEGAEHQVTSLRGVDDALHVMRTRADAVRAGAAEVRNLAGNIEQTATAKRAEIDRALGILKEVRSSVDRAAAEVRELNDTADNINRFVGIVSRIAEQTNLLALNAAIEAARAGAAGRGFAVVADEVRKLAEQAQTAADDVVQLTAIVTSRVGSTTQAMAASTSRVVQIEKVSRDIEAALTTIVEAAERTRLAADDVTVAADENVEAMLEATAGISQAARTAEGHAAAAEQVSASTQEQSAACEQMSSASAALLDGAGRLKELVAGLRTRS